jgi:hypothetical protein
VPAGLPTREPCASCLQRLGLKIPVCGGLGDRLVTDLDDCGKVILVACLTWISISRWYR